MQVTPVLISTIILSLLVTSPPPRRQEVPSTPFDSIQLHNGARAILRYGSTYQVFLVKGSLDHSRVTVVDGRLIVDKCNSRCPRGYELEIQIVVPQIAKISIADGGRIQSAGSFPAQGAIGVAVSNGGVIDIRSMAVNSVAASVSEGGAIYTRPHASMVASVVNGGKITYWGDAQVTKAVQGGGAIIKGNAGDADQPISESSHSVPPPPPVPPLPALKNP